MKDLTTKKILFVICGGVSAYKSLETIRLFKKNNAEIKTILTKSAKEFVTPLSIASLSQGKVYDDLFNEENETEISNRDAGESNNTKSRRETVRASRVGNFSC